MSLEKVLKYWLACSSGLLCRVLRGPIITPLLSKPSQNKDIQLESHKRSDVHPAQEKKHTTNPELNYLYLPVNPLLLCKVINAVTQIQSWCSKVL